MGTDEVDQENLAVEIGLPTPFYQDEHPLHRVRLPSFYLDRHEVTNAEYKQFVDAVGRRVPDDWLDGSFPAG
ncbi:MAG TPA: SUMF1/EgtB/PvdO family nonheme iron enzyme, partial [Nitrospiria bacterium]|nr:SUMF1/EgtB/PvdO family nonheme iron enzyme [Nitrospiria bacterium]